MRKFRRPQPQSGEVTISVLGDPATRTTVATRGGELAEDAAAYMDRLGLAAPPDGGAPELLDAQRLLVLGGLVTGAEYHVEGPAATAAAPPLAPDATVHWAYDRRMLLHDPGAHRAPETPHRLRRALDALLACPRAAELLPPELVREAGGSAELCAAAAADLHNRARLVPPRLATAAEVTAVHDARVYGDFLAAGRALPDLPSDVYCNEGTSATAARLAAGAAIDVARAAAAAEGGGRLGLCLVRPPGHHCTASAPRGFCLVNNVAVAARAVLDDDAAARVAIVDLDVHFGEGTAEFAEGVEPPGRVLYLSVHRHDGGAFYPQDARGASDYRGRGGCVRNVAVDTAAHEPARCHAVVSDTLLAGVTARVLLPRLAAFAPTLVLVSLGFDAAYGDPLGRMAVEGGFAACVAELRRWCLARAPPAAMVAVLEGGYNPEAVSRGVVGVAHALTLPPDDRDVRAAAAAQTPKTWAELRRAVGRRQREAEAVRSETAGHDAPHKCGAGEVPSDEVLLRRHEEWCEAVIRQHEPASDA